MAAGQPSPFTCRCGTVTGLLHDVRPSEGTHAMCHCNSCRRAMQLSGLGDAAAEGVDIWQTTPDRVEITAGADQLQPMQLSPKGLYRWTARCCDTPIANTFSSPGLPFAGILVHTLTDPAPLGPIVAHGFVTGPDGKQRHQNGRKVIWRFLKRTVAARLSGRWRQTPFFDSDGQPIAPPRLAPKPD
ncbi:DUF6151 family protein [Nioella nitratireducens]|uniref:DUF6151 family protein n=1 Tax=Nioella nitratireducens TaxID=1287720 RepID=UPI0008FD8166|nr:DUF6151 family protein [Nioella nitratireducens]